MKKATEERFERHWGEMAALRRIIEKAEGNIVALGRETACLRTDKLELKERLARHESETRNARVAHAYRLDELEKALTAAPGLLKEASAAVLARLDELVVSAAEEATAVRARLDGLETDAKAIKYAMVWKACARCGEEIPLEGFGPDDAWTVEAGPGGRWFCHECYGVDRSEAAPTADEEKEEPAQQTAMQYPCKRCGVDFPVGVRVMCREWGGWSICPDCCRHEYSNDMSKCAKCKHRPQQTAEDLLPTDLFELLPDSQKLLYLAGGLYPEGSRGRENWKAGAVRAVYPLDDETPGAPMPLHKSVKVRILPPEEVKALREKWAKGRAKEVQDAEDAEDAEDVFFARMDP